MGTWPLSRLVPACLRLCRHLYEHAAVLRNVRGVSLRAAGQLALATQGFRRAARVGPRALAGTA
eukprot:15478120-Alexandrium_andersonii.AAC.1